MRNKLFIVLLAAGVLAGVSSSVMAQAPGVVAGPKIGVLNVQRAIAECNEGKQAAEKLQSQFKPKQGELQAKGAEIERLQKQLRDQEKTLSDDARASLVRQLESKQKEFSRSQDDFNTEAQQAENSVIQEIGQKMMKVVEDYALKNGYAMILEASSPPVVWASSALEVTDDIIKLYNISAPSSVPAPGAPAAARPAAPAAAKPATPPAAKPAAPPAAKKP